MRGVVAAATPIPEPETVSGSAQTLAAPASVTDAYTADFNNATVGTVASIETEDQDAKTVVDGMKVKEVQVLIQRHMPQSQRLLQAIMH